MEQQKDNGLYDISSVEIREQNGRYGLYSLKNFREGDLVLSEPIVCSYVMRRRDFEGNQSDACVFVEAIYRSPDILGKEYKSFCLKAIEGVYKKPPKYDKKFLKKLSKRLKKPYKDVLNTWRIICTYHVRNHLYLIESDELMIRLQLSAFHNRINHHCSPNSEGIFEFLTIEDFNKPVAQVRAVRDINVGDEITYSYIFPTSLLQDVRTRQKEILDAYDFTCTCSKCKSES